MRSRISSIYSDALGLGNANSGSIFQTRARYNPLTWNNLPAEARALSDYRPWGDGHKEPAKQLDSADPKTRTEAARLNVVQSESQTFSSNLSPEEPDFSWHPVYKSEDFGKVEAKRQQGWHIQYGKRDFSDEGDEKRRADSHFETNLPSTKRLESSMAENLLERDLPIPQETLDFLYMSKFLSYPHRLRLARKLTSLLKEIVRQGTRSHSKGGKSDDTVWGENTTASYESVGSSHRGDRIYSGRSYHGTKRDGVLFPSNDDRPMTKRQQGWHINYGKRDGEKDSAF